jgi:hypothetical protein
MTIIATCSKGPSGDDVIAEDLPVAPKFRRGPLYILRYTVENRCQAFIIATVDR